MATFVAEHPKTRSCFCTVVAPAWAMNADPFSLGRGTLFPPRALRHIGQGIDYGLEYNAVYALKSIRK